MATNKLQWKRIAKGYRLPCDSLLMKKDGTIISVVSGAGAKVGQDAYYLPVEELKSLPKEKNEDEKVRKALLEMVHDTTGDSLWVDYNVHKEDAIAWLEKQGKHANFINKIQIGDKVTRNEDGVLVNLSQLNRVAKKDEKQGEQRTKLVDFDLNANDSDLQEETYFIPKGFHAKIDGDKVVIKRGEQKPTWKPSDGQIKALWELMRYAPNLSVYTKIQKSIESLYSDLKKL